MPVHIKNTVDELAEHQRIENGIVETEGKRAFFIFVKVGLQGTGDDFKHEFKYVVAQTEVYKPGRDNFVEFLPFLFNLFGVILDDDLGSNFWANIL